MKETTSREKILKRIRKALPNPELAQKSKETESKSNFFSQNHEESLAVQFAQQFTENKGLFAYCESKKHFHQQLRALLDEMKLNEANISPALLEIFHSEDYIRQSQNPDEAGIGISLADAIIARTGSIMISSADEGRALSVWHPVHIVLAFADQLFADLDELYRTYDQAEFQRPSMLSLISGPSRTADIEKTLVMGAHGPYRMFVFYIDQNRTAFAED